MRSLILSFFLCCFFLFSHAQQINLDSLIHRLTIAEMGIEKLELYLQITKTLNNQGSNKVIEYAREFFDLAEELNDTYYLGAANTELGRAYYRENNDTAYIYSQRAMEIYIDSGYEREKGAAVLYLAMVYLDKGEMVKSKEYIDRAMQLGEELKDTLLIAKSLNSLGVYYRLNNELELSLKTHLQGFQLMKTSESPYDLCKAASNLGYLYGIVLNNKEALYFLDIAKQIAQENQFRLRLASCYNRIALIYDVKNVHDSAMIYYHKAIAINLEQNNLSGLSYNYHNIGVIYDKEEDFENAEKFYLKALRIKEKEGNIRDLCSSYLQLGSVCVNLQKLSQAKWYLDRAYKIARKINDLNYVQMCYGSYADYNAAKGNYKKSYNFVLRRIRTMDTLFNDFAKETVETLQIRYKTHQKQDSIKIQKQRISLMKKQELIAEGKIKNRNGWIFSFLSIIGGLGFLFYTKQTQKTKIESMNKELVSANKNLTTEKQRTEILLQEVQHRVKNNLLFVASLLDLQSIDIENTEAKKVVEEGRNRVETMGLLHSKLSYKEDLPVDINMKDYLNELIATLMDTLSIGKKERVLLNVEEFTLDIGKAMPIGLIVNELIYNVFKHNTSQATRVKLSLKKKGSIFLVVEDNGKGLPDNFDIKETSSFGLKLVNMLCRQLKGHLSRSNSPGAKFELIFDE